MKKRDLGKFMVLGIFILLFCFAKYAHAQIENINGNEDAQKIVNITQNLADENARTEYLKQEWTKLLEKSSNGRVLLGISSIFKALSPLFKLFVGIEYSLTWLFFLSLFFWIAIMVVIYSPIKQIFQGKWWMALGVALIITAFAAQLGAISKVVSFFAPLFSNQWVRYICIAIGILVIIAYSLIMKSFGAKMRKKEKKEDEARREQKAGTIEKIYDVEIKASK